MIAGIGLDLVKASRMERWLADADLLARYFHPGEVEDIRKRRGTHALNSAAARFAAKEAFAKAIGSGIQGFSLRNVRVAQLPSGKPELLLYGDAQSAFSRAGGGRLHLSLSHDGGIAGAVGVIEQTDGMAAENGKDGI